MSMGRGTYDYTGNLTAGADVYGSDGEKIGRLVQAAPTYLLVEKGWLFIKDLYLPASSVAQVDDDGRIYLSYTKAQAEEMGRADLPTEGDAWYGYRTDTAATTGRAATATGTGYGTAGTQRGETTQSVPIVEEQLKAGVRETEAGKARIVKDVHQERQTLDVPVEREEVYITERATDRPATQADMAMRERAIDIPLREQDVVVQKEARVTGEVNVRKEVKRETERVSDTVRREDVHVEATDSDRVHVQGDVGTAGTTRGGTTPTDTAYDQSGVTGDRYGGTGKTVTDKREYDKRGNLVDKEHYEEPGTDRGR